MTINDAPTLLLALGAGILLGGVFYGGLWWTVNRAMAVQNPAPWFFGSLVLRTGMTMAGIYLVFDGQWDRLLACLLGFAVARVAVTRLTAPAGTGRAGSEGSAVHAP